MSLHTTKTAVNRDDLPVVAPAASVAPSLPPASGAALAPPTTTPIAKRYKLSPNSLVRKKAVAIVALRAAGYTNEEIAAELGIKTNSIHTYLWRASRAGFLVDRKTGTSLLSDPKDELEFALSHKIIRNLKAGLDGKPITDEDGETKPVTKQMVDLTLEVARGTMFKRFDPAKEQAVPMTTILAVKVEMPSTGVVTARPGALGGVPAYDVDGEVVGRG